MLDKTNARETNVGRTKEWETNTGLTNAKELNVIGQTKSDEIICFSLNHLLQHFITIRPLYVYIYVSI